MKNFSSRMRANSRHNSNRKNIVTIVLMIVFSLVLLYLAGSLLGKVVSYISVPVYGVKNWIVESPGSVPSYFRDRTVLLDKINLLEVQIAEQSGQSLALSRVKNENEELRKLFGTTNEDRIVAGVVSRPPALPYDAVLIDRGSNDGVLEGATAYYSKDHAIGFVSKTYPTNSLVTLFSTVGTEISVYVVGPNIYTTAYGEGGGVVRVSASQGVSMQSGNLVVIPSLEAGVLGSVQTVESVATQPEQHGYVTFDIPIQSLRFLSIGKRAQRVVSFEEAERYVNAFTQNLFQIEVPDEFIVETDTDNGSSTVEEEVILTE